MPLLPNCLLSYLTLLSLISASFQQLAFLSDCHSILDSPFLLLLSGSLLVQLSIFLLFKSVASTRCYFRIWCMIQDSLWSNHSPTSELLACQSALPLQSVAYFLFSQSVYRCKVHFGRYCNQHRSEAIQLLSESGSNSGSTPRQPFLSFLVSPCLREPSWSMLGTPRQVSFGLPRRFLWGCWVIEVTIFASLTTGDTIFPVIFQLTRLTAN